jgi:protein-L-isoaspartate(D-aspartate) O-methyltransferase
MAQALQGMAIDGESIALLIVKAAYKTREAKSGVESYEKPGLYFHFYDDQRREITHTFVGPWTGTKDWKSNQKAIPVPLKAKEMIVRVGLNGATGELWVDDLHMTTKPR